MSSTLSLEVSQKVFEIVGEYETSSCWINGTYEYDPEGCPMITVGDEWSLFHGKPSSFNIEMEREDYNAPIEEWSRLNDEKFSKLKTIPSPNFAELIRVLPYLLVSAKRIIPAGEALVNIYMGENTEPEGMVAVEKYLLPLL